MKKSKEDFISQINEEKKNQDEEKKTSIRSIKRKPEIPKANAKNIDEENQRMGVKNELDLLLGEDQEKLKMATTKKEKQMIQFTQDLGEVKKERQERYLTI